MGEKGEVGEKREGEGSNGAWKMQCHSKAVSQCRTGMSTWALGRESEAWLEWMPADNLEMRQL